MTQAEIQQLACQHASDWRELAKQSGKTDLYESIACLYDIAAASGQISDYDHAWTKARAVRAVALYDAIDYAECDLLDKRFGFFIADDSVAHYRRFE